MLDLEPIRRHAKALNARDLMGDPGVVLTLIDEVEQLRAEQDRIWPDLRLSLELLDTAFDMRRDDLYDAQGVNQAHRIIKAILAGEEPMRPRRVKLTAKVLP